MDNSKQKVKFEDERNGGAMGWLWLSPKVSYVGDLVPWMAILGSGGTFKIGTLGKVTVYADPRRQ